MSCVINDSDNTAVDAENGMCTNCHSGDMGIGWHAGPHGANDVGCADCHQSHARLDAVQQTSTQADVCADCHQLQRNETRKAFAHPIAEEKLACTDCHGMQGCMNCHSQVHGSNHPSGSKLTR